MAKTKKARQNSPDTSGASAAVNIPPVAPPAPKPQGKGGKACLTCGIIAMVAVVLLIVGFIALSILRFWLPPTFLFGLFSQIPGIENMSRTSGTEKNQPVGIPEMAVTQLISAADGGTIKANLPSGYTATLAVPKRALKKDTQITLTPFAPPGNANQNISGQNPPAPYPPGNQPPGGNNPPGQNPPGNQPPGNQPPGQNPPGNPPTNPPGGGGNNPPGNPPGGGGGNPPGGGGNNPPPGNPPDGGIGGVIIDPDDLIFDIPAIISFDPPAGSAGAPGVVTAEPATGVLVYTDPNGNSTVIPGSSSGSGSGSGSGGSTGGPIGGGGSVSGDPPTQDEAERIAEDTARTSGGTCTPEFIAAIKAMADIPGYPAGSIMARTLDDCLTLDWLREKCQNDPIALRRLYFEERLRIAAALQAPREKVEEINRLKNECVARYEFSGSDSQNFGGAIMSGNTNMWVCGYLDDEWQGSMHYQIAPPNLGAAGHYFTGTISSMYLPPRGGAFGATAVADAGGHTAGYFDLSGIPLGIWGNFDGESTLNPLNVYAVDAGNVQINMTERPCIPLAPLGR